MPDHLLPNLLTSHQLCAIYAAAEGVYGRVRYGARNLQGSHVKLTLLTLALHEGTPLRLHEISLRVGQPPTTIAAILGYLQSESLIYKEGDCYYTNNMALRLRMPDDALVPPSLYDPDLPRSTALKD